MPLYIYDEVDMLFHQLSDVWGAITINCDATGCTILTRMEQGMEPGITAAITGRFVGATLLDALREATEQTKRMQQDSGQTSKRVGH